jgi:linoleoyl-CoA desaturase
LTNLAAQIQEIGREARAQTGEEDVQLLMTLMRVSQAAELTARILMVCVPGRAAWLAGTSLLGFHLSVESQMNHSIMHGAYLGLPGAGRYTPDRFETMAVPFQSRTWREAHRIHHAFPSILGEDPDTVHPLFRIHEKTRWRPWHLFNSFAGSVLVFECWAFDYDRFLKKAGLRPKEDRSEVRKFLFFIAYQYAFFAILAGPRWKQVVAGTLIANVMRNLVFTGLQTASSVGHEVSTAHPESYGKKAVGEWCRFQIETSKNFLLRSRLARAICGGLDRHIEHHLYPNLPPNQLYSVSGRIRHLCAENRVNYVEYPSFLASLKDSVSYLAKLSV